MQAQETRRAIPNACNGGVFAQTEGEAFARSLYDLRIEMRDRMLAAMVADRDAVVANSDVNHVIAECVDRALETDSPLRRTFWLDSLADVLRSRCVIEEHVTEG